MIRYRPFLNTDPPAIAELWRNQPPLRAYVQPMTASLLEHKVLSKPYFDRFGLIVAEQEGRLLGFIQACLPLGEQAQLRQQGALAMLMVAHHTPAAEISAELLLQAEKYLLHNGVTQAAVGGEVVNPYYLGLYGGSALTGVLASDALTVARYEAADYQATIHSVVLQRDLRSFRPLIDRRQMQVRRACQLEVALDPPADNWWTSCTLGAAERTRYCLASRRGGEQLGSAMLWEMTPLSASWGVHAAGISHLQVPDTQRRQGFATFLLGESLRQMAGQGIAMVEVTVDQKNAAAIGLFTKLGFHQVDASLTLKKRLAP
ncbi:GNAT family N-acetyltransferase [Lignipirellula cremea]|uniref:Putative acetyltransferase n=1 Tax=Lignipirellula cremea TaxID=2528010 RepID=A0A518DNH8_9BACT|nr:GNAT family N-acetyltransferase [Lignipirellula cremea]QDU93398.1 putative acetyltransferase [Lignipirellula cremea]